MEKRMKRGAAPALILTMLAVILLFGMLMTGCGAPDEGPGGTDGTDAGAPAGEAEGASAPDSVVSAYLAVIDSIYQEDSALNENISILAMDPSDMTLTEEEKNALYEALGQRYGLEIIEKTHEQLKEGGYLSEDGLMFNDGVKITVSEPVYDGDAGTFTCGVDKWRSGLGAIGSGDVTAVWDGEAWTVTMENMYIS